MTSEYRIIEPEVAGGFGEGTELDHSTMPPTVRRLHYEFEGWLGDDLVTTTPCFIVTMPLKGALIAFQGSGYSFDDVCISKSEFFRERHLDIHLPHFAWLKVHGEAGKDDVGLAKYSSLVVSQAILCVLLKHRIANCTIRKRPFRKAESN